MKKKGSEVSVEERDGVFVICGTGPKNGLNGTIPGIRGEGRVLDLSGLNNLLVADLEYFVKHQEGILELVKTAIERREYFREHPEELEEKIKKCQGV